MTLSIHRSTPHCKKAVLRRMGCGEPDFRGVAHVTVGNGRHGRGRHYGDPRSLSMGPGAMPATRPEGDVS